MCDLSTFRATPPLVPLKFADYGRVRLGGADHDKEPARFLHLSDTPNPLWVNDWQRSRTDLESYVGHVIDMMELHWDLQPASVLLSITGSAQDFVLSPMLQAAFSHGLAKVCARAATALGWWVALSPTALPTLATARPPVHRSRCALPSSHHASARPRVARAATALAHRADPPLRLTWRVPLLFACLCSQAAHATTALVVSGGTNSGVMRLTGRALADFDAKVQCLGIATWGVINGRNHLEKSHDMNNTIALERTMGNSSYAVNHPPPSDQPAHRPAFAPRVRHAPC
jgi:hypothetical protein